MALDDVGWAFVEGELVSSQRSLDSVSDVADALQESTESEPEVATVHSRLGSSPGNESWWVRALKAATVGMHPKCQTRTLLLLSGCTGCFTEGAALQDCVGMAGFGHSTYPR